MNKSLNIVFLCANKAPQIGSTNPFSLAIYFPIGETSTNGLTAGSWLII
jgi:hypothetical protein